MADSSDPGRKGRRRPLDALVPPLGAALIRLIRAGVRLRVHGRETLERFKADETRYIHVFWHAHLLMMVYSYIGPRLVFMISQHRDGELIAKTVEYFGYAAARGSTTRGGGAALRLMMRELRGGSDIGFTPDGPRGPARVVQPGCIAAAGMSGVPIVPMAIGVDRAWKLNTWDRFVVPKPFSRALIAYGEPIEIERGAPIEEGQARVQKRLLELEAFAEENAADPSVGKRARR